MYNPDKWAMPGTPTKVEPSEVARRLIAARALIANSEDWFGGDVNSHARYCAGLAVLHVGKHYDSSYIEAIGALADAMVGLGSGRNFSTVMDYNNSRTHAEVIGAFDRAIAAS